VLQEPLTVYDDCSAKAWVNIEVYYRVASYESYAVWILDSNSIAEMHDLAGGLLNLAFVY
jgi:hypothetical protein